MKIDKQHKKNTIIIQPEGEIDLNNSPEFRKIINDSVNEKKSILIDLEHVSYMDSSGLATLVEGIQNTNKLNTRFALCSLTDALQNILSITRLNEIFSIYDTRKDALEEIDK